MLWDIHIVHQQGKDSFPKLEFHTFHQSILQAFSGKESKSFPSQNEIHPFRVSRFDFSVEPRKISLPTFLESHVFFCSQLFFRGLKFLRVLFFD
jgi:hypothetical protein